MGQPTSDCLMMCGWRDGSFPAHFNQKIVFFDDDISQSNRKVLIPVKSEGQPTLDEVRLYGYT